MPTLCGELKEFESPVGGGVSSRDVRYVDQSTGAEVGRRTFWTKHRMVFPRIRVGDQTLQKVFVASDGLGREIAQGARLGDQVCLTVYGHLLTRKVIIGLRSRSGASFVMPPRGLTSGLFWYAVFSPLVLLIPAVAVGMTVGMLGGKQGTALGLLLGVLYAVGMSWFSGYRLFVAYRELARPMQPAQPSPAAGVVGTSAGQS
ncbi:MAG TPA: hypothetical protein VLT82_20605 [Myxococcaceae bacterium]|nr:hypothetical protein [Myxococcaceae bacterium]